MKLLLTILVLLPFVLLHQADEKPVRSYECRYYDDRDKGYVCQCQHVKYFYENEKIRFTGEQLPGKTNENVDFLHLDITSEMHFVPSQDIMLYFTNLKSLEMRGLKIKKLTPLINCGPLEFINFNNNRIHELQTGVFLECENLQVLQLMANELNVIEDNAFGPLKNLEQLDLGYNRIQTLSRKLLKPLKKLQKLDLLWNRLSNIPFDTFRDLTKLTDLDLSVNMISGLDHRTFDNLINLERLSLAGTQIRTFPPGTFKSQRRLKFLDISNNNLKALDGGLLVNNGALEELNIEKNKLRAMGMRFFDKVNKLTLVHANDNECVHGDIAGAVHQIRPKFLKCFDNWKNNQRRTDDEL